MLYQEVNVVQLYVSYLSCTEVINGAVRICLVNDHNLFFYFRDPSICNFFKDEKHSKN